MRAKTKTSDCWYTPPEIVTLIQQCLNSITLDPCADDGKHVEACYHFTAADDGLSQQWFGRVFMNPPYSCPGVWIAKLQEEFNSGRVEEAIAPVPVATDTKWFHPLIASNLICFWKGRIKFLDTNYQPKMPARQSHALIYWGNNWAKFREIFSLFGTFNFLEEKTQESSVHSIQKDAKQKPQFKTGEYILGNNRVGQIIEDSPVEYFTVKYEKHNLKCYFWGQDDQLIAELAIAPQSLIDKFSREENQPPLPADFSKFEEFETAWNEWAARQTDEAEEELAHITASEIWEQEKQECNSHNLTSAQESVPVFVTQVCNSDSNSSESQKQTNIAQISLKRDTQTSITMVTCEECPEPQSADLGIICTQEELTSLQLPHPAPHFLQKGSDSEQQTSVIAFPPSSKLSGKCNLDSQQSKTSPVCSLVPIAQEMSAVTSGMFFSIFPLAGTMRNGLLSEAATLPAPTLESEYCWLRSPGALSSTGKGRPPGQTKQEGELKRLGLINKGEVLNPVILCQWYEIPPTWLDPSESRAVTELLEANAQQQEIFSILESPPSPCNESAILQNSPDLAAKQKFKVVTVRQPHASLIGVHKWFETRDRKTNYRGKILIHAAIQHKDTEFYYNQLADLLPPLDELPFGSIIATAELTDCILMTEEFISQQSTTELRCGLWEVGRYAWKLENVQILDKPIPARGMPGLWDIELLSSQLSVVSQESSVPLRQSNIKVDLYICDRSSNIGIIKSFCSTYFVVDWKTEKDKWYFWERDELYIAELAIAPQPLITKFLEENSPQLCTKCSVMQRTQHNKPWYDGKFNVGDRVTWRQYPELVYTIVKPEKGGHVVISLEKQTLTKPHPPLRSRVPLCDLAFPQLQCTQQIQSVKVGDRFRQNDGKNGVIIKIDDKIHSVLLDETGKVSSAFVFTWSSNFQKTGVYNGQIFLEEIKVGDRVYSCKEFRAGTVSFINSKFGINWDYYKTITYKLSELSELQLINEQLSESIPENFLEEKPEAVAPAQKPKPSKQKGCLYKYLENKKLKDGTIASYPRVIGDRKPDNPTHWRWGFNWEEKVDGEWKGRSIGSISVGAIPMIQSMQNEGVPLEEIIGFIRRSKAKK